jgi:hypothetical protein
MSLPYPETPETPEVPTELIKALELLDSTAKILTDAPHVIEYRSRRSGFDLDSNARSVYIHGKP